MFATSRPSKVCGKVAGTIRIRPVHDATNLDIAHAGELAGTRTACAFPSYGDSACGRTQLRPACVAHDVLISTCDRAEANAAPSCRRVESGPTVFEQYNIRREAGYQWTARLANVVLHDLRTNHYVPDCELVGQSTCRSSANDQPPRRDGQQVRGVNCELRLSETARRHEEAERIDVVAR
jgi:hypothetical protein